MSLGTNINNLVKQLKDVKNELEMINLVEKAKILENLTEIQIRYKLIFGYLNKYNIVDLKYLFDDIKEYVEILKIKKGNKQK
jgi:hypothetical protein